MSDRSPFGNGPRGSDLDMMSGAYVLNALSDDEREEFETHMGESDEIRQEVAELNETALLLGHAVEPVTPSAGLRSSIMDLINSTPQPPALETTAEANGDTKVESLPRPGQAERDQAESATGRHASPAAPAGKLLEPIPLARQRWFMRPAVLLGAAAAATALFFGGGAVLGQLNPATSISQPPSASGDVSQILAAKDVAHTAADISTGGKATLYWSNDLHRSAVILDGATSLPSGKTYQLWYIDGSDTKSAGTMAAGSNSVTQVLQGDLQKGDTVGITVEPTGGSKQPTGSPIVSLESA